MISWILIGSAVAVHVLQYLSLSKYGYDLPEELLAFRLDLFLQGDWWRAVTYAWIHSTDLPIHALFNLTSLHFLGRELEPWLGKVRFLTLYFLGAISAVGLWILLDSKYAPMEMLAGASGSVFALFTALARLDPDRRVQALILIIPVRGKIKTIVGGMIIFEIICWVFDWLSMIAHSAHLGGALVGFLLATYWRRKIWHLE